METARASETPAIQLPSTHCRNSKIRPHLALHLNHESQSETHLQTIMSVYLHLDLFS
jgi:hypothetical protein